ncbi:TonB-dependent receptor plug domain-containing protein [Alteromonas macleodii]|uniref:TonB-dependent receptor plug domain-containing protein n=1 Tax=Alteromonas macleodii TaxID=28108 RepID=UPI002076A1CD|nr:TonB-dependent receptor [Alteromonas macleodii]USI28838.1 TonB-dependent receptor [Alteromonas macleodii]
MQPTLARKPLFKLNGCSATFLALGLSAVGSIVSAQETDSQPKAADVERIAVTGSRIQRAGFETATPVNVVGEQAIDESGFSNVYDILKTVPAIGVGLGSANGSPNALSNPEAGASFINLRGLGTDRSLVLIDGRRRVSGSSTSSAVDLSMIPAGLIQRVEVITGGASAVYGADAVSGVVNMIMKDNVDGIEVSASTGASPEGSGGERVAIDFVGGSEFADGKGRMVLGISFSKEQELRTSQRDFGTQLHLSPNPANTGPNDGIPDRIHVDNLGFFAFSTKGAFNIGGDWYTDDNGIRLLDGGGFFDGIRGIDAEGFRQVDFSRLRQEQETLATRFSVDYDIAENISFFLDADYGVTTTVGSGQPDNSTNGGGFNINRLYRENPLLPDDLTALMDENGLSSFSFNRAYGNWETRNPTFDRTSYSVVAGFEGYFENDWKWNVYYQDSRYENNSKWANYTVTERVANAIDVIADPVTGEAVCRSGDTGCVPLYPLSQAPLTAEQSAYINHTALRFHRNEQQVFSASLAGDVLELPAGETQFALGVEHREESIATLDDGLARFGGLHLFRGQEPQNAELSVDEAYLEVVVPVLSGKSGFEQLDLEAAVRYSDYDTIGGTTATKLGFNWAINDEIRLRGSKATSVRAPNLSELFSPGITTGAFLDDPCDIEQIQLGSSTRAANCAALGIPVGWVDPNSVPAKEVVTGGNPDLSEEKSDSLTIGAVITPDLVDNLTFSIDYWDIAITDAIGSFAVTDIIKKCVDSVTIDNGFCSLITRDEQLSIERVDVAKINVGSLSARGIDFEGFYKTAISAGELTATLNGSYLLEHEQLVDENDPSSLFLTRNNPDNPKFRSNLNLSYVQGAFSIGLNTRYIGSTQIDPNVLTDESIDKNDIPRRIYNDLILGYHFENDVKVTATITNLADIDPPRRAEVFLGARGNYDNVGRFVSLRASYQF